MSSREPTPAQLRAYSTLNRNLLVNAGAGSGKTWVLAERFVHLLAHPHESGITSVSQIVAITFTTRAAQEMRARVRERLNQRLAIAADDDERARWARHVQEMDGARISTIHALAAALLRANAAELDEALDPAFAVLDETQSRLLADAAVDDALRDTPPGDPALAVFAEYSADVVLDELRAAVTRPLPSLPGTPLALRVFGDTPESCETILLAPLQPLDPAAMSGQIAGLQAIDGVNTPIGASLEQVANELQGATGTKIVVLVTDGEETCGGDPEAALRDIAAQGIDVRVNIVGFAVADEALKAQFREWAHLGNGQYFDAAGAADLGAAIASAVQPPYRVLDADGKEIARGLVDGAPVEVPAGVYRVEVQSAQPITIDNVDVGSGARVVVPLDQR